MSPYNEELASVPQIPRKRTAGDGTEPEGSAQTLETSAETEAPEGQSTPTIIDADDAVAFLTVDQLAKSQDRLRRNRFAIDTYHGWLDDNVQFGRLDKIPNQSVWIAKLPPGVTAERSSAVPNKASDLCNKVTDSLLADPPKPNPQPHVDDETADAAADLASEFLRQNAGESGINEVQQYRWALRNSLTRSTSFLEFDSDPEGGGYQAYQILAHPQATDPQNPLMAQDPMTGAVLPTVNPILRYVSAPTPEAPTGQFVEDASQADRVWLPAIVVRRHPRIKVVMFPVTAPVEDAELLILTDYCTLAEGRKRWKDTVGQMSATELAGLASWRPSFADMIVPFTFRGGLADGMTGPALDDVGTWSPLLQRRMYFHRCIIRKSSEYPDGLKLDITGANGGLRLGQKTMEYTVTLPTAGKAVRCRDIPFVQVTPQQDVEGLDPMGWPFEARFDGSAQADATLIGHYLDALERMANPHVFIRSMTAVDEDEWFDRSKPIVIGPSDQMPFYEQFSPLPPVVQFSEYLQQRQDTSSGLTATAQGLESPNSESGIAKRLTVRQAQISLAGIQQQLHGAFTRGWRIQCQIAQAEFTTPQLIQFSGEDASNEEQWWTGEDFAGIDDRIGIEPGTGTFMTAEDKANYIAFMQGQGWLDAEKAGDIGVTGIARDLGLPTDVTVAAIERAIATWLKGPPEGWEGQWNAYSMQKQQYDQVMGAYQQEAQSFQAGQQNRAIAMVGDDEKASQPPSADGGPPKSNGPDQQVRQAKVALATNPGPAQPPQPPQIQAPQKPWTPFEDRPSDTEPQRAAKWMKELGDLQMSPRYSSMKPAWRQCADEKYSTSRQAIAIATGASPNNPQAGQPPSQQQPAKKPQAPGTSGMGGLSTPAAA